LGPALRYAPTGYVHDGARWYDPASGGFSAQDANSYLGSPSNGNRYAYAADNPVNYTDPTGHSILGCIASVVGGVAAVGSLVGISVATAGTADVFAAGALISGAGTAAEQIGFFSAVTAVLGSGAGAADAC
jgi:RHS repeat-associated protein